MEKETKTTEKKARGLAEETLQIIGNVVVTTVSTAALMFSIAAFLKGKENARRK
ncbi:MAG: hypothetical protein IJH75_02250 [Mogibacterium sp.]|nr:hypothetical protein [Mogibacterium sp.]